MWAFPSTDETVVVGCDSSWESENAIVAATREASRRGAVLVLLAVVQRLPYWPDNLAWVARVEAESTRKAQAAADRAMARALATDRRVAMRSAIVQEPDSVELDEVARQAGLLVLSRRGDEGQSAFSLGSPSSELGRRFSCPILVVHDQGRPQGDRRPFGPDSSVVVGMDIRVPANPVLAVAASEAVLRDLPLVVVHALPQGHDADRAAVGDGWRKCREALRAARLPTGVSNRLVITQDHPVPALVHRVGQADLLVVGTRRRGGRGVGVVAGSVSRSILNQVTCDVMVVQQGTRATTREPASVYASGGAGNSAGSRQLGQS